MTMIDPKKLTDLWCDFLADFAPELSGHVKVGASEADAIKRIVGDPKIAAKISARTDMSPDIKQESIE